MLNQVRHHAVLAHGLATQATVGGGCGIRTREGLHPTRFPNPQTEIQADAQVVFYAREVIPRTLTDHHEREQLKPKLRPKVSGHLVGNR
jgi:hypothetical protein